MTDKIDFNKFDLSATRILLIDDHDISTYIFVGLLKSLCLTADSVTDGRSGIKRIEEAAGTKFPYDIVFMDIQMPELNGREVAAILRESGFDAKSLPIIAISADGSEQDREKSLAAGMQDHLRKPLSRTAVKGALKFLPGLDESKASESQMRLSLKTHYRSLKFDAAKLLTSFILEPSDDDRRELINVLHKLAGTASFFYDYEVGTVAKQFKHELQLWDGNQSFELDALASHLCNLVKPKEGFLAPVNDQVQTMIAAGQRFC